MEQSVANPSPPTGSDEKATPVSWRDLRDWIALLERNNELQRIGKPVDADEELGAITYMATRTEKSAALLFENITGDKSGSKILANMLGASKERYALAVGLDPDLSIAEMIAESRTIMNRKIAPVRVPKSKAPVNEVVLRGDEIDLTKFPSPKFWPGDGGRYIGTGDITLTASPDTGRINVGCYRQMLHGPRRVGMYCSPGKHGSLDREDGGSRASPARSCYETILVERDERIGIITLNRPKALNALNGQVMTEVTSAAIDWIATTISGRSSSPVRPRRSPPAPTSRKCRDCPSPMHWVPTCSRHGPSWRQCAPRPSRLLPGRDATPPRAACPRARGVTCASASRQPLLDREVHASHQPLRLRPGARVHARRARRVRQGLPRRPRRAGVDNPEGRLAAPLPDVRACRRPTTYRPCGRRATGSCSTRGRGTTSRSARPATAGWAPSCGRCGPTALTCQLTGTDAAHGSGEGEDDYHAYWSPDGKRIVYAHLSWNFITSNGQGKWDVRVANFVGGRQPHLTNVRVVRPANGHWYETQWWAPDGSGFLYTETSGNAVTPSSSSAG